MRIEITNTRSAGGMSVALCATFSGPDKIELIINEDELKKHRGTIVLKIRDLKVSGTAIPLHSGYSCTSLMRF